jgi:hypothetical protein
MIRYFDGLKKSGSGALLSVALFLFSNGTAQAKPTYTLFDVLGADETTPMSINDEGEIAGAYHDALGYHSFLRTQDGTIIIFDGPGLPPTISKGINKRDVITGTYGDANNCF